jgi:hypothetical protein
MDVVRGIIGFKPLINQTFVAEVRICRRFIGWKSLLTGWGKQ